MLQARASVAAARALPQHISRRVGAYKITGTANAIAAKCGQCPQWIRHHELVRCKFPAARDGAKMEEAACAAAPTLRHAVLRDLVWGDGFVRDDLV
jgi:hypothetical protein